jgi:hypothetical protein
MAPGIVDAVVLPGWFERDPGIAFLQNDCVFDPPLTKEAAEKIWNEFRQRAEALPPRNIVAPPRLALSPQEQHHAQKFLAFLHQIGVREISEVLKVDPFQLVLRQYVVVTDRAEGYQLRCANANKWMEECLPTAVTNPQVTIRYNQQNLDTSADIDLPHAEFIFGPGPNGAFGPIQMLRHITVMNVGNRMLLWAGYHRTYARVLSTTPTAAERSALVALTSNTIAPPQKQATGATTSGAGAGLDLFGLRPPLFADFFTDGLFMKVKLRKKRYQLQMRTKWVAVDDPT